MVNTYVKGLLSVYTSTCSHTDIYEIDQLQPISNKGIPIYEQGILFQILSKINWHNLLPFQLHLVPDIKQAPRPKTFASVCNLKVLPKIGIS